MKKFKSVFILALIMVMLLSAFSTGSVANAASKPSFKDVTINVKTKKDVVLKNPYEREYKIEIENTKIANLQFGYLAENDLRTYTFKGLNEGTTNVKVILKGSKKLIGEFKITVGNFPTTIKPKYKKTTLKFNKNGSNAYMSKSYISVHNLLKDIKHKSIADYRVETSDYKIVDSTADGLIYATGKGKANVTIFEKVNETEKKIGTIAIKVKKAKMNYVAKENMKYYDEGIFGQGEGYEFVYLDQDPNLKIEKRIVECLINNKLTGSKFKKSDYTITYKVNKDSIGKVTVDKKGLVTVLKEGSSTVNYTIKFKDGSKYKNKCRIWTETSEEF